MEEPNGTTTAATKSVPFVMPVSQIKEVSEEMPNLSCDVIQYTDVQHAALKSPILIKWMEKRSAPQLEKESSCQLNEKDPQLDEYNKYPSVPLNVETDNGSFSCAPSTTESSINLCCACTRTHSRHHEYPDPRPPPADEENTEWIECNNCRQWYHQECVDLEPYEVVLMESYSCKICENKYGIKTQRKKLVALHRNKAEIAKDVDKATEVGTKPWIEDFVKTETLYPPPSEDSKVKILENGVDFEAEFDRNSPWINVYLIKEKAGLGLKMPEPGEMYIDELVNILGERHMVDTIDVYRQQSLQMSIGRFRDLLHQSPRARLYNILSLEFTATKLANLIRPPSIVAELSWAERYWPDKTVYSHPHTFASGAEEACDPAHIALRPNVELFCLVGMGGSFTDFHIDFGGSSVWYHVYRGKKIFYIVEPTQVNFNIYQKHQERSDKEVFLADMYPPGTVERVEVMEGQTLLIPAGWIHAVYTPVDSLVFGGNFLHNLNVPIQLEVNYYEATKHNFDSRFIYPNFELINFYAARSFTEIIREMNEDETSNPPLHIVEGGIALVDCLTEWIEENRRASERQTVLHPSRSFIHGESKSSILLQLSKEVKAIEKRIRLSPNRFPSRKRRLSSPIIQVIETKKEEEGEEEDLNRGPSFRMSIGVPSNILNDEPLEPLRLKIARESTSTMESYDQSLDIPCTPRIRIRLTGDDDSIHPVVVNEEEQRSIDGVNMVRMFAARSSSGRRAKPAAWLKEQLGDEIERESRLMEEEREKADIVDEYAALDTAEGSGKTMKKNRKEKIKSPPTPRIKKSSLSTTKQRLADRMKNLKRI